MQKKTKKDGSRPYEAPILKSMLTYTMPVFAGSVKSNDPETWIEGNEDWWN